MDFLKLAESGAKKICTKDCHLHFDCGHPDKDPWPGFVPLFGTEKCPLEKYHVQHDSESFSCGDIRAVEPTDDELTALCGACSNGSIVFDKDGSPKAIADNWRKCMDCPVEHTRESIEEERAEAACS